MLEINREELDAAIADLNGMFAETERVLANYEAEKEALEKRGQDLDNQLATLQQQHLELLLQKEGEKDTKKFIAISKKLETINEDMKLIGYLKDQLKDDLTALKQSYIQPIKEAYSNDSAIKRDMDVNYLVDYMRHELVSAIAEYASKVRQEESKVYGTIADEFLDNNELMATNKSFKRSFDFDRTNLSYSSMIPNLLTRNNINLACSGHIAPEITKPKEVK